MTDLIQSNPRVVTCFEARFMKQNWIYKKKSLENILMVLRFNCNYKFICRILETLDWDFLKVLFESLSQNFYGFYYLSFFLYIASFIFFFLGLLTVLGLPETFYLFILCFALFCRIFWMLLRLLRFVSLKDSNVDCALYAGFDYFDSNNKLLIWTTNNPHFEC